MKLIIVGDPNRKKQDQPLIREGKKVFNDSEYISIDDMRIEVEDGIHARVDDELIGADCVLPVPTDQRFDMFTALLKTYENRVYMPFTFTKYVGLRRHIVSLSRLKELGYMSSDFIYGISPEVFENFRDFPADVRVGSNAIDVNNKRQLMRTLNLRKAGQSITLTRKGEETVTKCIVVGSEVIATLRVRDRSASPVKLKKQLRMHIGEALSFLGSDYGEVTLRRSEILGISVSPDIAFFEKYSKKAVASHLLRYVRRRVEMERSVIEDFMDFFRRFRLGV